MELENTRHHNTSQARYIVWARLLVQICFEYSLVYICRDNRRNQELWSSVKNEAYNLSLGTGFQIDGNNLTIAFMI